MRKECQSTIFVASVPIQIILRSACMLDQTAKCWRAKNFQLNWRTKHARLQWMLILSATTKHSQTNCVREGEHKMNLYDYWKILAYWHQIVCSGEYNIIWNKHELRIFLYTNAEWAIASVAEQNVFIDWLLDKGIARAQKKNNIRTFSFSNAKHFASSLVRVRRYCGIDRDTFIETERREEHVREGQSMLSSHFWADIKWNEWANEAAS